MSDDRVLAIVPARNEEGSIGDVIADVRTSIEGVDVLVVNDGSVDGTATIARRAGARVLDLPFASGVGAAMRLGYRVAAREDYAWTVRVDADGQHTGAAAEAVLGTARNENVDLVIGTRVGSDSTMPRAFTPRRAAMRLLAARVSHASGVEVPDATSGLRATSSACTALFAAEFPSEFLADTVEPILLAARHGLRVGTCLVQMRPRSSGRPSHGSLTSSFHVARTALAITIAAPRPGRCSAESAV